MKKVFLLVLLMGLAACSSQLRVATDYDVAYNFAAIKTYAWLPAKDKKVPDPHMDNSLMHQRLYRAMEQQMAAQGYEKVALESADVLITYQLSSNEKLSVKSYRNHFGYYPCFHCFRAGFHHDSDIEIKQYRAGSFMIDIIEPEKRELLWRGVSERRLPGSVTPAQRDQFVNETVTAIINRFPPK
ncbi:DUF4136 domain-containing protein [Dasania marina]|uniref:DUF4136 domain-containing protein n=1 Tax=Dasania marina TaxID=471499 RepID=UPI0030D98E7E|tara:strand:+ start:20929 stop:21483 length:555 start_codon:yes stop_codon:yes gene_type:complete